jgi:hypothetical protein
MQRFSEALQQDREFEVMGEIFKWRYPPWEDLTAVFDEDSARFGNGSESDPLTARQNIEEYIKRIPLFLDPTDGAIERWTSLAHRKDNPIPHFMYHRIYTWLLEVTSGRPTSTPSPSDLGDGTTDDTSPDE